MIPTVFMRSKEKEVSEVYHEESPNLYIMQGFYFPSMMVPKELVEIAHMLDLDEEDIEMILSEDANQEEVTITSPVDTYPGGRYGTVSIKDF